MNELELKVGDVVRLKSDSYNMTIGEISSGWATCYWQGKEATISSMSIPVAVLVKES